MMKKRKNILLTVTVKRLYNPTVDFGKIKQLRLKAGLNQTQAAKRAGWKTQQQWADFESGQRKNPRLSTIVAAARVLGCKVQDLMTE